MHTFLLTNFRSLLLSKHLKNLGFWVCPLCADKLLFRIDFCPHFFIISSDTFALSPPFFFNLSYLEFSFSCHISNYHLLFPKQSSESPLKSPFSWPSQSLSVSDILNASAFSCQVPTIYSSPMP